MANQKKIHALNNHWRTWKKGADTVIDKEHEAAEDRQPAATADDGKVLPKNTILGWKFSAVKDSDVELYLVEVSFQNDKAYTLLTMDELDEAQVPCVWARVNVLAESERAILGQPSQILAVASRNPYGPFAAPPEWDFLKDRVPSAFRKPIMFDAELWMEWEGGERTWVKAARPHWVRYLADAGRENEESARSLFKNHYLNFYRSSTLEAHIFQ
ncbi:hypothetical protein IQ06DRAFT_299835 [Phaeosphaeriaceae sp. SRC1lsM3a]|nr:hypothetical protein IQ06DRAFT_299835 [Stagonospora sp. SRC1lsM3a]